MTPAVVLAVAIGAAVGAPLRFVVERQLASTWPWGTWIVNVVGSAILGALLGGVVAHGGVDSSATLVALVGTGFCGSLTTFGGFAAQVVDLAVTPTGAATSRGSWAALGYGTISVLTCVAVAALTYWSAVSIVSG